jgi:hypothetical protein
MFFFATMTHLAFPKSTHGYIKTPAKEGDSEIVTSDYPEFHSSAYRLAEKTRVLLALLFLGNAGLEAMLGLTEVRRARWSWPMSIRDIREAARNQRRRNMASDGRW